MTDENDEDPALSRTQRRLLRRIYNGRTIPLFADDRPFLTYREATRHLLSLTQEGRDAAYAQMKAGAQAESHRRAPRQDDAPLA